MFRWIFQILKNMDYFCALWFVFEYSSPYALEGLMLYSLNSHIWRSRPTGLQLKRVCTAYYVFGSQLFFKTLNIAPLSLEFAAVTKKSDPRPPPPPPQCTWFTFLAGHWKDYLSFKFNDIIRQCSVYYVSNISGKQRSLSGYRFRVFFPPLGFKEVLSHYIFKFIFSLLVLLHTKDNHYPYVGSHLSVFHTC